MQGFRLEHIEKIKGLGSKLEQPVLVFVKSAESALALASVVEGLDIPEKLKYQSRMNCVVNLVSALEIFFKESVVFYERVWNREGISELLKEKVTLNDAYVLFRDNNVSRASLIAHYHSFLNVGNIVTVFSKLVGGKFFNELEKYLVKNKSLGEDKNFVRDWGEVLNGILLLRNRYVHERTDQVTLEREKLTEIANTINYFVVLAGVYFGSVSFNSDMPPFLEIDNQILKVIFAEMMRHRRPEISKVTFEDEWIQVIRSRYDLPEDMMFEGKYTDSGVIMKNDHCILLYVHSDEFDKSEISMTILK